MIRPIVTDRDELSHQCHWAIPETSDEIVKDLLDTAKAHPNCVGLAANQIGYSRTILVVKINGEFVPMINPEYKLQNGGYKSVMESCLSFPGEWAKVRRYKKIRIEYEDPTNKTFITLDLKGHEARIVQHEMDHLEGGYIMGCKECGGDSAG